jgi:hypothetical protein
VDSEKIVHPILLLCSINISSGHMMMMHLETQIDKDAAFIAFNPDD